MTLAPHIRPAVLADAPGIARVHVHGWQRAYRGLLPDAYLDALDVEDSTRRRQALLADVPGDVRNWVLDEAGGIVGWAATGPPRDQDLGAGAHELYAIYLGPDRIGEGLGRVLMAHCLEDVTARGYGEMTMWVLAANERAQRFYAAAGFDRDPRVPTAPFRDTGATKLRMRRELRADEPGGGG